MTLYLETQAAQLEAAAARTTEQRQALREKESTGVYTPEELERREAALIAAFDQTAAQTIGVIDAEIAAAEKTITNSDRDPIEALSSSELERVNGRLALTKEDCEALPYATLVQRARLALDGTDKAAQYLYARYLPVRVERDTEAARASGRTPYYEDSAHRRELAALAEQLRFKVDDQRPARTAAEEKLQAARAIRMRASRARSEANGSVERAMAELRQRYANTF